MASSVTVLADALASSLALLEASIIEAAPSVWASVRFAPLVLAASVINPFSESLLSRSTLLPALTCWAMASITASLPSWRLLPAAPPIRLPPCTKVSCNFAVAVNTSAAEGFSSLASLKVSKFKISTPAGIPSEASSLSAAALASSSGFCSMTLVTKVVSGVMTVALAGPLRVVFTGSPVAVSVPP